MNRCIQMTQCINGWTDELALCVVCSGWVGQNDMANSAQLELVIML